MISIVLCELRVESFYSQFLLIKKLASELKLPINLTILGQGEGTEKYYDASEPLLQVNRVGIRPKRGSEVKLRNSRLLFHDLFDDYRRAPWVLNFDDDITIRDYDLFKSVIEKGIKLMSECPQLGYIKFSSQEFEELEFKSSDTVYFTTSCGYFLRPSIIEYSRYLDVDFVLEDQFQILHSLKDNPYYLTVVGHGISTPMSVTRHESKLKLSAMKQELLSTLFPSVTPPTVFDEDFFKEYVPNILRIWNIEPLDKEIIDKVLGQAQNLN